MFGKNKKIKNVKELEKELKGVYERTDMDIVHSFMEKQDRSITDQLDEMLEENEPKNHPVSGCCDCPFVRSKMNSKLNVVHNFCIWDGTHSNIQEFIDGDNICPTQCPLKDQAVTVRMK